MINDYTNHDIDEPFVLSVLKNSDIDTYIVDIHSVDLLTQKKFTSNLIVIALIDFFWASPYEEYPYWGATTLSPYGRVLAQIAKENPSIKFIALVEHETISDDLPSNINVVTSGGCIADSRQSYANINPVLNKSDIIFPNVCLNRQMRPHRIALISLLYGMNLNRNTHISSLKLQLQIEKGTNDLLEHLSWEFEGSQTRIRDYMISGFKQVYDLRIDKFDCYNLKNSTEEVISYSNAQNFNNSLRILYENSLVEIVSETVYIEPDITVTEKFLNSVLGCNFPILISAKGTVAHLREIGFDMFDDVVDHSYDMVDNPIDRMYRAINGNIELLNGATLDLWNDNKMRFAGNVEVAKTGMFKFYEDRFYKKFNIILNQN